MTSTASEPSVAIGPGSRAAVTAADRVDLADLRAVVEVETDLADLPLADRLVAGVPVYRAESLRPLLDGAERAAAARDELATVLADGPGVFAVVGAVPGEVIDRATAAFEELLAVERRAGAGGGDHYAEPGANERLWNSLEKLAVADPEVFVDYHGNDMVDLAAAAWLGPAYQLTAQINVINPGGRAQSPHRDYHLGFTTDERAAEYPLHAHRLSPVLTLQGAIAHCDMPAAAGSTMLLPHSQKYDLGYLAWRRAELIDYFERNRVQLELAKGDLLFFNPAVIHAGGTNSTADVRRMANLLQISSAMGRALEAIDRERIVNAIYPTLRARWEAGHDRRLLACAVAAGAEGYPFPTNLDRDQPIGRLTPPSQYDLVIEAMVAGIEPAELADRLTAHAERRRTH